MTRPKKSLGQNFLRDEAVIDRIVESLDLRDDETVVEIGAGEGALTKKLVQSNANVVAIEIDSELVPKLRNQFARENKFSVIEADVLAVDFEVEIQSANPHSAFRNPHSIKLVGNLPYYISTAILQKLSAERQVFSNIVLMLQREVAKRVTALPGNSERGFLTVITEAAFEVTNLFDVPPTAFFPEPKVWSSVVMLTPKPKSAGDEPRFKELISAAFAQKRKTITNNLKHIRGDVATVLEKTNIDSRRRAETLTLDEWFALYKSFAKT
ncbi:MAG: 16S rRNA (adenine(1518)-N(6)/adenine(1519)-N(6))-dimethyltransferase RsmA [Pyrinomonadaceae bacterium]